MRSNTAARLSREKMKPPAAGWERFSGKTLRKELRETEKDFNSVRESLRTYDPDKPWEELSEDLRRALRPMIRKTWQRLVRLNRIEERIVWLCIAGWDPIGWPLMNWNQLPENLREDLCRYFPTLLHSRVGE